MVRREYYLLLMNMAATGIHKLKCYDIDYYLCTLAYKNILYFDTESSSQCFTLLVHVNYYHPKIAVYEQIKLHFSGWGLLTGKMAATQITENPYLAP